MLLPPLFLFSALFPDKPDKCLFKSFQTVQSISRSICIIPVRFLYFWLKLPFQNSLCPKFPLNWHRWRLCNRYSSGEGRGAITPPLGRWLRRLVSVCRSSLLRRYGDRWVSFCAFSTAVDRGPFTWETGDAWAGLVLPNESAGSQMRSWCTEWITTKREPCILYKWARYTGYINTHPSSRWFNKYVLSYFFLAFGSVWSDISSAVSWIIFPSLPCMVLFLTFCKVWYCEYMYFLFKAWLKLRWS